MANSGAVFANNGQFTVCKFSLANNNSGLQLNQLLQRDQPTIVDLVGDFLLTQKYDEDDNSCIFVQCIKRLKEVKIARLDASDEFNHAETVSTCFKAGVAFILILKNFCPF
jgi:hypothetical protein